MKEQKENLELSLARKQLQKVLRRETGLRSQINSLRRELTIVSQARAAWEKSVHTLSKYQSE